MSFQTVRSEETLYAILLVGKTCFKKNKGILTPIPQPPNLKIGILHSWVFKQYFATSSWFFDVWGSCPETEKQRQA